VVAALTEKRLLIGGEWIETGEWIDVRSPYSATSSGVSQRRARRDVPGTGRGCKGHGEPLPAHKRAEILVKVAGALADATTRSRA
jgi:hypothetical protein